jgi:acyl-CoA synthetase (AMP-forming)/AMP-acid ligase II
MEGRGYEEIDKMENLSDLLVLSASRYPEYTAVVHRGRRVTYRQLNERVNRLGHHLLDMGVKKGDRVGVMFYNSHPFVESFYAVLKIGAVAVPINFRMVSREVKWILDNSRSKALIYSEAFAGQVEPVKKAFSTVEHLIYSGKDVPSGEHDYERLATDGIAEEPKDKGGFEDRSYIMYTGGTTGLPKGAVHTHRSVLYSCLNTTIAQHVSDTSESQLMQVPMFHQAGINLMMMILAAGGKLVVVQSFDPLEILQQIEQERVTGILLVPPTTYTRLLDFPRLKDFDTTSVIRVHCTAGFLSKPLMLRIFDAFPSANIYNGYGLSESPVGAALWITRSMVEKDVEVLKSTGRAHPFVEIRLVDDQDREVPVGEVGEVAIRGSHIIKEYFDQPELTAQTIREGWLHTGDLMRKDKDGYYYFVDRKKDMIKSGGENVFAVEVEGVILTHPSVETCVVIGVPDAKFGEAVMAVIKLRKGFAATEEEIIDHCKQHLASYKKPRRIVFVESFPMNDAGKVQKFKLREQYSQSGASSEKGRN